MSTKAKTREKLEAEIQEREQQIKEIELADKEREAKKAQQVRKKEEAAKAEQSAKDRAATSRNSMLANLLKASLIAADSDLGVGISSNSTGVRLSETNTCKEYLTCDVGAKQLPECPSIPTPEDLIKLKEILEERTGETINIVSLEPKPRTGSMCAYDTDGRRYTTGYKVEYDQNFSIHLSPEQAVKAVGEDIVKLMDRGAANSQDAGRQAGKRIKSGAD